MKNEFGLGDPLAKFKVYIANQPNFKSYSETRSVTPLSLGEIYAIGKSCGNGWRKVFNVYAKLVFAIANKQMVDTAKAKTWQEFRDKNLLQVGSNTALLFSSPLLTDSLDDPTSSSSHIHIVMGKTYATSLNLFKPANQLDNEFAIDRVNNVIVCPYFDYRQLSNIKIIRLVELIRSLKAYNSVNK
ncbi:DUF6942 family protein [Paraglaciecola sp.]|uniref:DUF6942 family protein n=1 Tax=Paraglaciecola sp. TaxID=1920173 RepID=UPI003EF2E69E